MAAAIIRDWLLVWQVKALIDNECMASAHIFFGGRASSDLVALKSAKGASCSLGWAAEKQAGVHRRCCRWGRLGSRLASRGRYWFS